jgi:hypothetical protein
MTPSTPPGRTTPNAPSGRTTPNTSPGRTTPNTSPGRTTPNASARRVLVGFADALAAIESVWSLADHGFEVHAFARSGTRPPLRRCRDVRVSYITPPERDARRATSDLARVIGELRPAAVLPLDDHAVWLANQVVSADAAPGAGGLLPGETVLAGPAGQAAELALDKSQQLKAAGSAGFTVPPSCDPSAGPLPGPGPWMVKPVLAVELDGGRLRRRTGKIAYTPAEARAAATAIGGPAVAQPMIEGTGEGIFGLATAAGVVALSAHRRIRMMNPRGSGSSACRSVPVAEALAGPVREFLAAAAWRGIFMIELLRDGSGTPWFMELNGRAWGSMALACRRGLAYPAWAVHSALDPAWTPAEPAAAGHLTARHLGREIVHLGAVLAYGGAPRLRTVRDVMTVRRSDCWYNWRRGNPGVFAADTWATLSAQFRRAGR